MIRVLHIVGVMDKGGAETFIMNLYRNIDKSNVQFDFVVHRELQGDYDIEIRQLGGEIYVLPPKSKGLFKNLLALSRVIKKNKYNVIHRHGSDCTIFLDLIIGKLAGAKILVSHSHSTNCSNQKMHMVFRTLFNFKCFKRIACSEEAGKWMYNKRDFQIIKNCIDTEKFTLNQVKRVEVRTRLGINNKLVIGHVGRLTKVKNHEFLFNVFKEVLKLNYNSVLIIVGKGELENQLKNIVRDLSIEKNVLFLGIRDDIDEIMQAMDVLVFPSIYEGLPVTLIEAQATGLKCLVSSNISSEVKITDDLVFKSLGDGYDDWADKVLEIVTQNDRKDNKVKIENSGYGIEDTIRTLCQVYKN